jgi:glucose uptake protein GlcU
VSTQGSDFTEEQSKIVKQLGRRRAFGFFFGVSAILFLDVAFMEGDMVSHSFDDIAVVAISAIAVILILATLKKRSLPQLKRMNNILTILGVLFLIMTFVAISIEINDANDIGDDFPKIFIAAAMLVNRFV